MSAHLVTKMPILITILNSAFVTVDSFYLLLLINAINAHKVVKIVSMKILEDAIVVWKILLFHLMDIVLAMKDINIPLSQ